MNSHELCNQYIVTRYFLQKDSQMSINDFLQTQPRANNSIFSDLLFALRERSYMPVNIRRSEFRLYFFKQLSAQRILLKFARRKDGVWRNATDKDIQAQNIDDYPFSYIIVDIGQQLFLIQRNNEITPLVESLISLVQKSFSFLLSDERMQIIFSPITEKGVFWDIVEKNAGKIHTIEFELLSPNFLGQSYTANQLMKELRRDTNTESLKMTLKNESGKLKINKSIPFYSVLLEYISNGGGKWNLHIRGKRKPATSEESVFETTIDTAHMESSDTDAPLKETFDTIASIEEQNHNSEEKK